MANERSIPSGNLMRLVSVLCMNLALTPVFPVTAQRTTALPYAHEAIGYLEQGDTARAAARVQDGLKAVPASTLLHNMAGAVLLLTEDLAGSEKAFSEALHLAPTDALAEYGLAVVDLARGRLDSAGRGLDALSPGADPGVRELARQYLGLLMGSPPPTSVALPAYLDPGRLGLEAASALQRKDRETGLERVRRIMADPTTARYSEPIAPLMTYDAHRPLAFASPRLRGIKLQSARRDDRNVLSGSTPLRAEGIDGGFVSFRVDGELISVVNARPYTTVWDTTRMPNGPHVVETVIHDSSGQEASVRRREVITRNPNAPPSPDDQEIRQRLWRILAFRPSKASTAMLASTMEADGGNAAEASRWRTTAAAIRPEVATGTLRPGTRLSAGAPLWRGDPTKRVVALTFDDGPKPGITDKLLAILEREGVRATFFVIGRHAAASPDLLVRMSQSGMEVANHSYSHPNLARIGREEARQELLRTNACVADILGQAPRWFRPPGGNISESLTEIARGLGLRACMWTVNAEGMELLGADAVVRYVLGNASPGAIILLHNGRPSTVTALPRVIRGLRERGYRFVTVSELANAAAEYR